MNERIKEWKMIKEQQINTILKEEWQMNKTR